MVQLPESGGNLVLYDATWDETKELNLSFKETVNEVKKDSQFVKLKEGDLIIFAGGEIWHEITQIEGRKIELPSGGLWLLS